MELPRKNILAHNPLLLDSPFRKPMNQADEHRQGFSALPVPSFLYTMEPGYPSLLESTHLYFLGTDLPEHLYLFFAIAAIAFHCF